MLFRRKIHAEPLNVRIKKGFTTFEKCLLLFIWPTFIGGLTCLGWYYLLYKNAIHFVEKLEGIVTAAWIPQFGILYSLLIAIAVNTVWSEYKAMRAAVKRYDFDAFIDLRDEDLSPVVRVILGTFSLAVLVGFMFLKYPDAVSGIVVVFGVSFLLTLMLVVIIEIDDPCAGVWFIKNMPEIWLTIDAKKYREERSRKLHEEFLEKHAHKSYERESHKTNAA